MIVFIILRATLVDRVIVLKEGQIIEDDNHQTLIKKDGFYATMYRRQAEWYEEEVNAFCWVSDRTWFNAFSNRRNNKFTSIDTKEISRKIWISHLGSFHLALPFILIACATPGVIWNLRLNYRRYILHREQTTDQRLYSRYKSLLLSRSKAAELRIFNIAGEFINRAMKIWKRINKEKLKLEVLINPIFEITWIFWKLQNVKHLHFRFLLLKMRLSLIIYLIRIPEVHLPQLTKYPLV